MVGILTAALRCGDFHSHFSHDEAKAQRTWVTQSKPQGSCKGQEPRSKPKSHRLHINTLPPGGGIESPEKAAQERLIFFFFFPSNFKLFILYWGITSVQSLSRVLFFEVPWTAACQASLSITNSWNSLKLLSIELVMPSILCHPLLLLPSIFPSIRVFSNESALRIRWPKYWSFSINPSNEYSGLISLGWTGLISL